MDPDTINCVSLCIYVNKKIIPICAAQWETSLSAMYGRKRTTKPSYCHRVTKCFRKYMEFLGYLLSKFGFPVLHLSAVTPSGQRHIILVSILYLRFLVRFELSNTATNDLTSDSSQATQITFSDDRTLRVQVYDQLITYFSSTIDKKYTDFIIGTGDEYLRMFWRLAFNR